MAAFLRVALFVADPYPYQLSGLSARNGDMAHNILAHDRWLVLNLEAEPLLRDAEGRILDPEAVDLTAGDQDPEFVPYSIQLPGPALILAALWKVTGDERYVYLQGLQIVIDSLVTLLVYWISMQLFRRRRAALVAAGLYALWLPMAALMRIPFYDSWAAFVPVTALALLLKTRRAERAWLWLCALGVVVGCGLYFRAGLIFLPVMFALALIPAEGFRRAALRGAVPLAIALAILTPLTVRNYVVFDRFIPANTGFGQVLWQGLGERSNSFGAVNDDVRTLREVVAPERPDLRYGSPEYDDFLREKALEAISQHPGHYLELIGLRFLSSTIFMHANEPDAYADLRASYDGRSFPMGVIGPAAVTSIQVTDYAQPIVFLLAAGTFVALWARYRREFLLLLATNLAVLIVPLILGYQWRYVAPGFFVYFIAVGLGVDVLLERRPAEA